MWGLARKYNINHRAVAKWNAMAPNDTLRPGQKLVLWLAKDIATTTTAQAKAPKLPAGMDVRPPNSHSSVHYRVRMGDSLSTIAQRFRVRVADLRKWNTLQEQYIQPGQHLKLYVDVTAQTL